MLSARGPKISNLPSFYISDLGDPLVAHHPLWAEAYRQQYTSRTDASRPGNELRVQMDM